MKQKSNDSKNAFTAKSGPRNENLFRLNNILAEKCLNNENILFHIINKIN